MHPPRLDRGVSSPVGTVVSAVLVVAVFALDISVRLGFAAGLLYVLVVLLATRVAGSGTVAVVTGMCVVLTGAGFWLSPAAPAGLPESYVIGNRVVTVMAIAAVGWLGALALRTQEGLERANRALRETQGRLRQQNRMLEIAGEVGHFGGWLVDVRNDTVHWSAEVARIHGLDPESMHNVETGVSFYVPEDQPRIAEAFARCVRDGTPFNEELQLVRQSDGALRWVNAIGRAERNEDGEVDFVHGALQDITERIEAQVAAEASRRRLETLGESMPFVIWTARADGALDYLSEEFWRITGILPTDAQGDAWTAALHPDDRERAVARWSESLTTGEAYTIEFRVRDVHRGYRWHYASATPERNGSGEIVRWWGSSIDIHEMRVLQEEATALAAQLNDTLESIGDAVLSLDAEWRVTFVNSHGERLLQHTREELMGRNIWRVFPEAIGSVFQHEYERAVAERRPVTFGAPFEPLDIYAEVSAYPHEAGLTIYFRAVSERRAHGDDGLPVHETVETGNTESTD